MAKPRPFRFPLSIGTDICSVGAIRNLMTKQDGKFAQRFVHRLLTERERKDYSGLTSQTRAFEFLAGRWAVKEAVIKAHSPQRLTFHDITIRPTTVSPDHPELVHPPVAEITFPTSPKRPSEVPISISHHGDYATAVCLGHVPKSRRVESDQQLGEQSQKQGKQEPNVLIRRVKVRKD